MSRVIVRIPMPLRSYTGGSAEIEVDGATVGEVLDGVGARSPELRRYLFDERGLRQFVNVYVGSAAIDSLQGLATGVCDGDVLSIVPAVAGGDR